MRYIACLVAFAASTLPAFANVNATFTQGSTVFNTTLPDSIENHGYPNVFDEVPYFSANVTATDGQPLSGDVIFSGGYYQTYIQNVGIITDFSSYYLLLLGFDVFDGDGFNGAFPGFVTYDANKNAESLTFVPGTYNYQGGLTITIAQTPEPSSFALLGTGLFGVVGVVRRRVTRRS